MVRALDDGVTSGGAEQRLKVPPNSIEAEQSLLGGLMLDHKSWDKVADVVTANDFYRKDHRLIFAAIARLAEGANPSDVVTVSEHLDNRGELEAAGGLEYLATLANETPGAANARSYARILRERSMLRSLISAGNEISGAAFATDGRSAAEIVDAAERLVFEIAESGARGKSGFKALKEILPDAVDRIDLLHQSDGDITGISTGFTEFDKLTAGLQPGDLIIIAGRPSMGKTTLAINIAENAAIGSKVPTAIYSMEMPSQQLAFRMISSLGRVDQSHLRTGRFPDEDWSRINTAVQLMSDAPIFIDDSAALSPTEIRARARRLQREHGLGLIVIDYLQLMTVPGSKENRATEISEISRSLKALAKELSVPVIALSQLNRSVEQRTDKRPVMSDLRESGAIEQDADLIAFIYREEVYNQDTPRKGIADIAIAKQRNGPIGDFPLTFVGRYTKFENWAPNSYADEAYP
ncbi:MAG: replicative DNA helicase [Gammaproteobacteria bacterium]|nr:replicative DNA helicase [Gammaproteobacteria bacterium]MDH5304721.1 replicative DNA helicase [Gammaproteobacteria bacterium]MDH5321168.1 replicative DNA helicase [Gammaproteobacteria bacterium]